MGAIARRDIVALKVKRNVVEGLGVAINVEGLDVATGIVTILLGGLDLAEEVLREVGGCWARQFSNW